VEVTSGKGAFSEQVKMALGRINDVAFLETLPLARAIPQTNEPDGLRLRSFLIARIERLKPDATVSAISSESRQYQILKDRYLLHKPLWETEHTLGLGERQIRREHQRALNTLAGLILSELGLASQVSADDAEPARPADVAQAVQRVTPSPREFDVTSFLQDAAAVIAQARPSSAGGPEVVVVQSDTDSLPVFTDRGILHLLLMKLAQVVLSGNEHEFTRVFSLSARIVAGHVQVTLSASAEGAPRETADACDDDVRLCQLLAQSLNAALDLGAFEATLTLPAMPSLRKILIVDDESPAIELFRSYLAGLRFEMEAETRPELALARALAFRPHLILIDVMMPAMDGWELLQRLRHAPALRDVPIIACSVLNDGELARSLGATQFLRKPILRHQLITVVQAALSDG
jgi:CheY-like chemotaxis protein